MNAGPRLERNVESRWVSVETVPVGTKDPVPEGLECLGGKSYCRSDSAAERAILFLS